MSEDRAYRTHEERYAKMIRDYWAGRGYEVKAGIKHNDFYAGSNLVDALPRNVKRASGMIVDGWVLV